MKKTLAAVAVLGAFAGSALAADVQLYGVVDLGFSYTHVDSDTIADDLDKFSMDSGNQSGSRWGIKGTEDLGNGLTVGFILEDGFDADDGSEDSTGVMFNRESSLFLQGGFGKIAFGRMGSFNQGQSSWSLIGRITPFGTSFGNYTAQAGNVFAAGPVADNSIAYQTPDFAGFKLYAMCSMGSNDNENESSSDRYYGIAATYDNGPVSLYAAVDSTNYKSANLAATDQDILGDPDDSLTVTLGGSWNFDVAKVYLGAQYFDSVKLSTLGGIADNNAAMNPWGESTSRLQSRTGTGYSILLGADAPVAGGKLMGAVAYIDAEQSDRMEEALDYYDFSRWVVSVGYDYPLSKRTNVYAVASYMNDDMEMTGVTKDRIETHGGQSDWNPSAYTFMIGMRHKF